MYLQEYLKQQPSFIPLCRNHHVGRIYGFDSAVNNTFDPDTSDIDLLVEIEESDPIRKGSALIELWNELELLFKRKVDLVTPSSLRNPVLKQHIEASKVLLYER